MKKIISIIGVFLFLGNISPALAATECKDGDQICECSKSWSRAFDSVHEKVMTDTVGPFFNQNTVAGPDMFSARRSISMEYGCRLSNVCEAAKLSGNEAVMETRGLSMSNGNGGASAGDFASCATDQSIKQNLEQLENYEDVRADLEKNCSFLNPEPKDRIEMMWNMCSTHAKTTTEVFDYTLKNMIWKDNNRKMNGFFNQKIYNFLRQLKELQTTANSFVINANAAFGKICATK